MKISQKIRKIWHDVFYKNSSDNRNEFALKCLNVVTKIDLHEKSSTIYDRFRFRLHLSLCQACKNYYDVSKVFSNVVKKTPAISTTNLEKINKSLLEKYSQTKNK